MPNSEAWFQLIYNTACQNYDIPRYIYAWNTSSRNQERFKRLSSIGNPIVNICFIFSHTPEEMLDERLKDWICIDFINEYQYGSW